jgi:DNA-directed RNA polymerase
MDTQTDQLLIEQLMHLDGAKRYDKEADYKRSHQSFAANEWPLFKGAFPTVADAVYKACTDPHPGRVPAFDWKKVLGDVGTDNCAFIGLQTAFYKAIEAKPEVEAASVIGKLIFAQIKGSKPEYEAEVTVGLQVLGCVMECGLFAIEAKDEMIGYTTLQFTDEAVEQMHQLESWQRYMAPIYRPMVSKPNSVLEGSYLDPAIAKTVQMVKTSNKDQRKLLKDAASRGAQFVEAADIIQSVPLRINGWALEVVKRAYKLDLSIGSIPPSKLPEKGRLRSQIRSQQAGFLTDLNEALEYSKYPEVYLPATMDFRGRVYAKPHLNHQRSDYVKSLWLFSEGKPLDAAGLAYLKIHTANTGDFQKMSKAPFADRIMWVNEHWSLLVQTAKDPWADLWWTEADSPFCFLAACNELRQYEEQGEEYVCHLPIAIDGSCSGLQHYSAMLRDEVGGAFVNLTALETPQDVYREVAGIVNQLVLEDQEEPYAQEWLAHKVDRKVCKRATMTLCYGSKQFGWRDQLMEDFMNQYKKEVTLGQREQHPFTEPGKASAYMAKKLDVALRKTVKAAVEGMDWLQATAGLLASENKPVVWTTPVGFPVVNGYYEPILKQIDITIKRKRQRQQLLLGYTDKLKKTKQRSTLAPNFVHSLDACHLMMVAIEAKKRGINSMLLIHDSFGCLPTDMAEFANIVREEFVQLYDNYDPFQALHENALLVLSEKKRAKLTAPPPKGNLDIHSVLESQYAFA